jgi:hypothetical protein
MAPSSSGPIRLQGLVSQEREQLDCPLLETASADSRVTDAWHILAPIACWVAFLLDSPGIVYQEYSFSPTTDGCAMETCNT